MPLEFKICCDGCKKEFNFEELERLVNAYKVLTRNSRNKSYENTCIKCGRKTSCRFYDEEFQCPQCLSDKKLKDHKISKKENKPVVPKLGITKIKRVQVEGVYTCDECKESFDYKKSLSNHKRSHVKKKPRGRPNIKPQIKKEKKITKQYTREIKDENIGFECSECGDVLATENSLKKHISMTHKEVKEEELWGT